MASEHFVWTDDFIRQKQVGYITLAGMYFIFVVATTAVYLHRTRRLCHQSLWLNAVHIGSALVLGMLFVLNNAFAPWFPCFLNLWGYHLFGFLWVFSFIARALRFLFQYEYHQAKLNAPTLGSQFKGLSGSTPAGLDTSPAHLPSQKQAKALLAYSITQPASEDCLASHATLPSRGPAASCHSMALVARAWSVPPPTKVSSRHRVNQCDSHCTRYIWHRWWHQLQFKALINRVPWIRKRKIFSERMLLQVLVVLLWALFVYLVFVQTFSPHFTVDPIATHCPVVAEYVLIYVLLVLYIYIACPAVLFWVWNTDEPYGLRRDLLVEIVLCMIFYPLFHFTAELAPRLVPYFSPSMFLFVRFFLGHIMLVVVPTFTLHHGRGRGLSYHRTHSVGQDVQNMRSSKGSAGGLRPLRAPSNLDPNSPATAEVIPIYGQLASDFDPTATLALESHVFAEILDNPRHFGALKRSAAKCFSAELILFLEDYQYLKLYTVYMLWRASQERAPTRSQSVSLEPANRLSLTTLPPPPILDTSLPLASPGTPRLPSRQLYTEPNQPPELEPPVACELPLGLRTWKATDLSGPNVTIVATLQQLLPDALKHHAAAGPTRRAATESMARDKARSVLFAVAPVGASPKTSFVVAHSDVTVATGPSFDTTRVRRRSLPANRCLESPTADASGSEHDNGDEISTPAVSNGGDPGKEQDSYLCTGNEPSRGSTEMSIAARWAATGTDANPAGHRSSEKLAPASLDSSIPSKTSKAVPRRLHSLYYNFYCRYIVPESDFAVNLSHPIVNNLESVMRNREYALDMFDAAHRAVLDLLFENVYPNYIKSLK